MDVRVTYPVAVLHSSQAKGQLVPTTIETRGLIDTGTDVSAVAPWVLQQLSLPVSGYRKTQGIGGSISVRLFEVTRFILNASQPHLPWLDQPDRVVLELPSGLPVDVLIRTCKLLLDGPGGQFTLEF